MYFSALVVYFTIAWLATSWELRFGDLDTVQFVFQVTHKYIKWKVPKEIGVESKPLYLGIDIYITINPDWVGVLNN